jgi:hypothetical protein
MQKGMMVDKSPREPSKFGEIESTRTAHPPAPSHHAEGRGARTPCQAHRPGRNCWMIPAFTCDEQPCIVERSTCHNPLGVVGTRGAEGTRGGGSENLGKGGA